MTTTIPTLGLAAIFAATLVGCDVQTWEWTITIDGVPARCSDVGAGYVQLYQADSDQRVIGDERYPCELGSTTTSYGTEPRFASATLLSPIEGTWPLSYITGEGKLIMEDPVRGHTNFEFPFGTLVSDFLPDRDGLCGQVVEYSLVVEGAVLFSRFASCGQPVVLPEQWNTLREFGIEVRGFVDVGGGDLRACHRTAAPVQRRIEGDPDPVPVPFNPAPEDAAACAPFAPPTVPTVCGELQTPEGALALPDGACPKDETQPCDGYEDSITVTGFASGQTLDDLSKLRGVCVNMEHSWMRDLVIYAQCPNGTRVMLSDFAGRTGGEVHLGMPNDDDDTTPIPGVGWDYCWTPTATNLPWIPYANANMPQTLPAGDYQSSQPLSAFVGCPLDGDWTIRVEDRWNLDNGFIFRWSVKFDPSIVEDCEQWP